MSVSRGRLFDLFQSHPRYVWKPYLEHLLEMEEEGAIEINEVSYTTTGDFSWFLRGVDRERPTESVQHKKLKRIAASYFNETGSNSVRVEVDTWFGRADVGCLESNRYAECGRVRAEKFLQAFGRSTNADLLGEPNPNYSTVEELLYIPYKSNKQAPITMISLKNRED